MLRSFVGLVLQSAAGACRSQPTELRAAMTITRALRTTPGLSELTQLTAPPTPLARRRRQKTCPSAKSNVGRIS